MQKRIDNTANERKQTIVLVAILAVCVLALVLISVALFNSCSTPVATTGTQYAQIPALDGMNIYEATASLDGAGITYEIIPTQSRNANRVEKIEYVGKTEDGKTFVEVGTSVKIYANVVGIDKVIYLTFDDGPTRDNTDSILDQLDAYGIKATFFVLGKNVVRYPDKIHATFSRGHLVGCHSHTHEFGEIYADIPSFVEEIELYEAAMKGEDALSEEEFAAIAKVLRFPGGTTTNSVLSRAEAKEYVAAVREMGYKVYDWTALTGDAAGNETAKEFIDSLKEGLSAAKSKEQPLIVLLHDKWSTEETLSDVLDYLVSEGYYFDTVDGCPEYTFADN